MTNKNLNLKCKAMLLVSSLCWPAPSISQDLFSAREVERRPSEQRYDSATKSLSLLLKELEQQYHVKFAFEDKLVYGLEVNRSALSNFSRHSFEEAMSLILNPLNLKYKRLRADFYIIQPARRDSPVSNIREAAPAFPEGHAIYSGAAGGLTVKELMMYKRVADRTISGRVTDMETGEGLPGVSVMLKGSELGTATDPDGNYSLTVPGSGTGTLVFSFIGYTEQEVSIGSRATINVALKKDVASLEEVVVIGYGTVKKSDLTGSVSSVDMDDLKGVPMTSIDQGLGGRAAGVMVTQTSGMPGAVASIRIRGTSSLQGGNEPLYVIDGFPVYNGQGFGNTGGKARMSGLSTINPADIESIEILKDASATAIYGARAANGVVLITTKSGTAGRDMISFDAYTGVQNVVNTIDLMDAQQYANLVNEAFTNDGLAPMYDQEELAAIRQVGKGTDWQNEIFRTAPTQNYQLSFSGGDEKTVYSVSGNYFIQDGVILNSNFKRYSARLNLERKLMKNFLAGTHLTLSKSTANAVSTDVGGQGGVVNGAMKMNPILPVFSNEELRTYTQNNIPGLPIPNPVASALEQVHENQTFRVLGDMYGQWEIVPNLKARVSLGVDVFSNKTDQFIPSFIYESSGIAKATVGNSTSYNWLNENTLSYSRQISDDHFIDVVGGITFQKNMTEGLTAASQGFVNDILEENNLGAGEVYNQPGSSATDWSLISYLGRINYNFMEKFLLSVNARVDGSSRFGKNNKYAFFPSAALAWRMSEENFVKSMSAVSNMKLRVSYGLTGNQEIGLYNSLPTLGNNKYTFGRTLVTGFFPNKIPNPDLKWERTAQFDIGIDLGFFNERLRITSDYYHKKTTDLIYSEAIPFVSGFGTSLQNIGSVQNQGLEIGIGSDNLVGEFGWSTNFNISFNKNKVLELGDEEYKDIGSGDGHLKTGAVHRLIVGQPIGLFYGYRSDGIFRSPDELEAGPKGPTYWLGGRRYIDISGPEGQPDGVVDATYDRTVIGDPNPDFFGGLTNTFFFKGFELSVFMQFSYGNDLFNYNAMELESPTGGQNVYADLVDRWTPENPDAMYPKATTNRSALFTDRYIEDGSYLKVKNLTLGYNFNTSAWNHVHGLRVYISGQNLLTFTDYRGYDPEVSYRGASNMEIGEDFGGYPQAKTIMLGLKLDLN